MLVKMVSGIVHLQAMYVERAMRFQSPK
jgi:hypothetical protein